MNAVVSAPDPVPLPAPLPEPPTLPASYASSLRDQIGADSLTLREQGAVLMELKAHLGDAEERGVALDLMRDLRRRSDIAEVVAKDLDNLFAEQGVAHDGFRATPGRRAPLMTWSSRSLTLISRQGRTWEATTPPTGSSHRDIANARL